MVKVVQDAQPLGDDVVRLVALDVGDEADAAGVVFVRGLVQTAGSGGEDFFVGGGERVAQGLTPTWA